MRTPQNLAMIAKRTKQVRARNKTAGAIVAEEGIAVDDLFGSGRTIPNVSRRTARTSTARELPSR